MNDYIEQQADFDFENIFNTNPLHFMQDYQISRI
jgi:hypothetical protein